MTEFDSFDPFDKSYLADPYPMLARIQEFTPALHVAKGAGFFLLTRYADVVAASKNHAVFSSTGGVGVEWKPRPMMPMYDPPKHTQLRRLVAPFFTPKAVQIYTTAIKTIAQEAIEAALSKREVDIVHDIAEPISLVTMATILGVPRERQHDLRRWADNTMEELAGGLITDDAAKVLETTRREFVGFLRESINERRQGAGADLVSTLIHANDSERLTDKEVVAFCVLLMVAGFEPTVSAIANLLRALALQPELLGSLPGGAESLELAANELVRWDSPVHAFFRNTLVDTTVDGVAIPANSKVMFHFAAANRDPSVFASPTTLVLDRNPNPHVAFGAGVHHCLGSVLARAQLTETLRVLQATTKKIVQLEPEQRKDNLLFHSLASLRARLEPL